MQLGSHAAARLRVDEAACSFRFGKTDAENQLRLVVHNPAGPLQARLRLEWLDTRDGVRGRVDRPEQLRSGANILTVRLPFDLSTLRQEDRRSMLWFRVQYRVEPSSPVAGLEPAEGVLTVGHIAPEAFALRLAHSFGVTPGQPLRVRVRALHPVTEQPVSGVQLAGIATYEDAEADDVEVASAGRTDASGHALLAFAMPQRFHSQVNIEVTGRRGGFEADASSTSMPVPRQRLLLTTDKPIYQPGQTLRIRLLAFDPAERAMAGQPFSLRIEDPEDSLVFRTEVTTSRFGIASAEWPIPESLRLGDYSVQVEPSGGEDFEGYFEAHKTVRISRYELPTFSVVVEPDKPFYLPGQDAAVKVRADYLFGKPVSNGRVRIARERDRTWDYDEQKWEIDEAESYSAQAAEGAATLRIPLAEHHDDLDTHERFEDIEYAAYFTDASTGRTEQRRFALRVTREPIHIYIIENGYAGQRLPQPLYISTSYADGTPAGCEVSLLEPQPVGASTAGKNEPPVFRVARKMRTNRYGLAKVSDLMVNFAEDRELDLVFEARDSKGQSARHTERFWRTHMPLLQLETDKALYAKGEPIAVRVASDLDDATVFLDIVTENRAITSRRVRLHGGQGRVVLPGRPEYSGEVTIHAYFLGPQRGAGYEHTASAQHTVLFPAPRGLQLDVRWSQPEYQPGQKAAADLRLRMPGGRIVPAALGLVVFDKSVEERARTDAEFSGRSRRFGFAEEYESFIEREQIAGIRRTDLDSLNMAEPLPEGLDLVAEVLLRASYGDIRFSDDDEADARSVFGGLADLRARRILSALKQHYAAHRQYPEDVAALRWILDQHFVDFDLQRDPWNMPFDPRFSFERDQQTFTLWSLGPDRKPGTRDDFSLETLRWPCFERTGMILSDAVERHARERGEHIRDLDALAALLRARDLDLAALRDPWGTPYRFEFGVQRDRYTITVRSAGPDRKFEHHPSWHDDFTLWVVATDYFAPHHAPVQFALVAFVSTHGRFFENEAEVWQALAVRNLREDNLRDPWDRPYYAELAVKSRYSDLNYIQYSAANAQGQPATQRSVTPVTEALNWVYLRSAGPDGQRGTSDDFDVASFRRAALQYGGKVEVGKPVTDELLPGNAGAITGIVTDPTGAVVPGAKVTATHKVTERKFHATTGDNGSYLLRNLPPGFYEVNVSSEGFRSAVVTDVPVRSSSTTQLNATLEVGSVAETITVESGVAQIQTTAASIANLALSKDARLVTKSGPEPIATPRLREFFPETLYWQPEILTDAQGRARIEFPLADTITTWRISALASTEDGKLGSFEGELRTFQPFFVEHDPPRALTAGDEIALPVVLRNYHHRSQAVDVEMLPAPWFTLLGDARKQMTVPAGRFARELFPFRAILPVKDGKQRVTAAGRNAGDAIEKPVLVRPNGEEIVSTAGQIFTERVQFDLAIPPDAIAHSTEARVKLYPNLMAHVAESVEGILQRPYGCAEQTISSTYPSLLVVRYAEEGADVPLVQRARRYLKMGYERLLNYRAPGGGFTYWGRGEPDAALSAYALRFLHDASDVIDVDEELINSTNAWLASQLTADGRWVWRYWGREEQPRRTLMQTTYIARVLAATRPAGDPASVASLPQVKALNRALDYLAARVAEIDEPYALASFALAAADAGRDDAAASAVARLRALARDEGDGSYWVLETNTPFYGWGLAGRVETTALVMQALLRAGVSPSDPQIVRGTLFLLRAKDRYGVWHSTQATVQVLDTLLALISAQQAATGGEQRAEVLVNGALAATVPLPAPGQLTGPILVEVGEHLMAGGNRVEIRRPAGSAAASAQLVSSYYVPWSEKPEPASRMLQLAVQFSKTVADEGDEVRCTVKAERLGHRGYGMMIAEIGLPPGADVDRASLERAKEQSGWALNHYDVLPDRLVVYLWPQAGGLAFEFAFKPRYGMTAKAAPSQLYDYYNPEARVALAPALFRVRAAAPQLRASGSQ